MSVIYNHYFSGIARGQIPDFFKKSGISQPIKVNGIDYYLEAQI